MREPIQIKFDVEPGSALAGGCQIAASLFLPDQVPDEVTAVVAVPGGTYTRQYWHVEVPGSSGYSCVEHLTGCGLVVLALDNLGTGESSRAKVADDITHEVAAGANAAVARQFTDRVNAGELAPALPAPAALRMVGLGHSLGGQLTAVQQAIHGSYDRIALLGSSFRGFAPLDSPDAAAAANLMATMAQSSWETGYLDVPRELLKAFFHAADVPNDVLVADDARATVLPRRLGVDSIAPMRLQPIIAAVDVPVFLTFAELDTSPDPPGEVANFPNSPDITLFRLPGSAHNHNHSTTRRALWNRLIRWLVSEPAPR